MQIVAPLGVDGPITFSGVVGATLSVSSTDNWAPSGLARAFVVRVTSVSGGGSTVTGIDATGVTDGRMLVVENASSGNLILERESTSSSAANRITYGSNYGTSLIVEPNASVILRYDAAASRWRLAASGVPTNTSSFVTTNTFQTISSAKTFTSPPTFTSSSDTSLPIFYSSAARLIVGDPSYEMGMGIRFVNTYADFILGVDVSGLTIGVPPYGSGGNNYPVYTGLNPPPPSYESIAFLSMRL